MSTIENRNISKCCQCGIDPTFEQKGTSWEELNCYRLTLYPNDMLVMTNASPEAFTEATETWDTGDENIETVLHAMGYVAMACNRPATMLEFAI